ncbi:MAG: hypothetical protein ACYC9O_00585 [Candidatus Latescibacterota bacterium]
MIQTKGFRLIVFLVTLAWIHPMDAAHSREANALIWTACSSAGLHGARKDAITYAMSISRTLEW